MAERARAEPLRLAVAGRPILHSRSPQLFQAAFAAADPPLRGSYLRLLASSAAAALALGRELELDGMNVTAPFKTALLPHLTAVDETACAVEAVNTVILDGPRALGSNTDAIGAAHALDRNGVELAGRRVAVVGTGGAARAAALGIAQAGAEELTLLSRQAVRARAAATALQARLASLAPGTRARWAGEALEAAPEVLARTDVVVSCAPRGLTPIDPGGLWPHHAVLDANYGSSPLEQAARERGCRVVPGEAWLLEQAAASFERLAGQRPADNAMAAAVAEGAPDPLGDKPNIALVGFMGVGKSAVGAALAERLGGEWLDTDTACERVAGTSVAALFRNGEQARFRELERSALGVLDRAEALVVACGGGALLDRASRQRVRRRCLVVWLWAPLDRCLARLGAGTRPLLAAGTEPARARALLDERRSGYFEAADLVLSTATEAPGTVARQICDALAGHPALARAWGLASAAGATAP